MSEKTKELIKSIDAGIERCKIGIEENESSIEEIKRMLAKTKQLLDKCEENMIDNYMRRTNCYMCKIELSLAEAQYVKGESYCKRCTDCVTKKA